MENVVHYFASSARRLEIRKRILLLVGPPASGKSSVVALIKRAVEDFTRTDQGATYAIRGCPMQEEPLHLVPKELRPELMEHYGVYVEGDLCPRCRYLLRAKHGGKASEVPVTRVTFAEYEAVGIGYYLANNPNPTDASLLVGSVDTSRLGGDRLSVAGKAFRLDGELNVANRGIMEMVEIFKADSHLLTTLLSLAQEQLIKMDRFGSVYADEVIVGHANEGDFDEFKADRSAEALKDRIIELRIPYNLTVGEEVKIYDKMVTGTELENVHLAPLTLPSLSVFAVLSRLDPPGRQGMTLLDKLRLYDGIKVPRYSLDEVPAMRRHSRDEGMSGVSPRYVMNRLSTVASTPDVRCITPLNALDSLWKGLGESIGLADSDEGLVRYIELFKNTVEEYGNRAVADVQRGVQGGVRRQRNRPALGVPVTALQARRRPGCQRARDEGDGEAGGRGRQGTGGVPAAGPRVLYEPQGQGHRVRSQDRAAAQGGHRGAPAPNPPRSGAGAHEAQVRPSARRVAPGAQRDIRPARRLLRVLPHLRDGRDGVRAARPEGPAGRQVAQERGHQLGVGAATVGANGRRRGIGSNLVPFTPISIFPYQGGRGLGSLSRRVPIGLRRRAS